MKPIRRGAQRHSTSFLKSVSRATGLAILVWLGGARSQAETDYKELAKSVQIRRDEWGVPHITAPTEEGASLGMGYAQTEDYPQLLPKLFVAGRGESAKYFGAQFKELDLRIKKLRIYEDSVERFGTLKPNIQAILNGYAAGYNMALEKSGGKSDPWVRPITGADVLAHGRNVVVLEFTLSINRFSTPPAKANGQNHAKAEPWNEGAEKLYASAGMGADAYGYSILPGSNMWAIGKERSKSGRGILLANPHLQWSGSQTFYEAQLTVPGVENIYGSTLIGSPGVTIGFNENLGWSHTVNRFDSHDIYELENDPANPENYIFDGKSLPLKKREITLEVKTDTGVEKRNETVYDSRFGPVVFERDGKRYALKSPNLEEAGMIEEWNLMAKAKNLKEFQSALDLQAIPMFNICYADREGNCFYIFNGRIPKRPDGYDWAGTVPGNTSKADWSGVHRESELPQLLNPKGGYVQNCNDAPWYTTPQQLIDKALFPKYMSEDFLGLRTQMSVQMLESKDLFTLEDVKTLKFNTKMLSAERCKDDLVAILERAAISSEDMRQAADVLKKWDGRADVDSKGALLYSYWFSLFQSRGAGVFKEPWTPENAFHTPRGIVFEVGATDAMKFAIGQMKDKCGKLDAAWGDVSRLKRGKLNLPMAGGPGELGLFRVLTFRPSPPEKAEVPGERIAVGGDSFVMAVEFTDPPKAFSVTAYGETERENSPHFTDQSELFAKHRFKDVYYTETDVTAHAKRTYHPGE